MMRGEYKLADDGRRWVSRIHVEDLAACALAAGPHVRGETFVIADDEPSPQIDVVRFVCETFGAPFPESAPTETLHETLRADRAIDARASRERLGVTLRYPSYREGLRAMWD